ncbi:MutS-related protein [Lewinella sp. IMCC34191]|uniref:MutS-related protein n=1 Tax=Lewinella sp. IMCC34191 TaxID=2259172 RepID=UPI000E25BA16|nr:hypothetical protein [Lewinella sp. IMCC34191]
MNDPLTYYNSLAASRRDLAGRLQQQYDRLALVRLLVFFLLVAALIVAWSQSLLAGLLTTVILLPLAAVGIRRHLALGRRAAEAQVQAEIAKGELCGLSHDFRHYPDGSAFLESGHPYAIDLDIFGPFSLYQFINRTVTAVGARRLADHLSVPATHAEARSRRANGQALSKHPDWCVEFRTVGHDLRDDPNYTQRLLQWVDRPSRASGTDVRVMRWLAPLLTVAGLWFCFTQSPWQLGLLFFVPAFAMLRRYHELASSEHAYTAEAGRILQAYSRLLAQIEERYPEHSAGASSSINRLAYAVSQLDVRYNPFVFLLEISGLWSLQWLYRLDRWREANREHLESWIDELARVDALVSWATLRFNRPDWTEPELTTAPTLEGQGLGHPLLAPGGRVTNDIDIHTDGHIHLVTGSNMAGKSTWLRTVGLNVVLARAGGPVCASFLRTAALQVWTSMRTQDDLSESTSSFYAELKRLKAIIEAVSTPGEDVFFLLDEILKGTNSRDRHTGSRALIRQLIHEKGAGIIATHDLELADLENEPGSRVENYAMEVQTRDGELVFDYKLHRGVSRSFNATALMARMGIKIDPKDIKLTHD